MTAELAQEYAQWHWQVCQINPMVMQAKWQRKEKRRRIKQQEQKYTESAKKAAAQNTQQTLTLYRPDKPPQLSKQSPPSLLDTQMGYLPMTTC